MAIEPEFVRLIKRWIRPVNSTDGEQEQKANAPTAESSSTSAIKPMQLDDDEDDLR